MSRDAPLVIGGLGGSGTRVVARLLQEAGVFIGTDLNDALDNLWFTFLLKRPARFPLSHPNRSQAVRRRLRVLQKAMLGKESWSGEDLRVIMGAAIEIGLRGHGVPGSGRRRWAIARAGRLLRGNPAGLVTPHWGWKEPNTHLYLEELADHFPQMRFLMVIRHGLDMAYSRNTIQLRIWGAQLGVEATGNVPTPRQQLQYWIAANQRAARLGAERLGDRFCQVNYDELCAAPERRVPELLERLGIGDDNLPALVRIPTAGRGHGRYREHDLTIFDPQQLEVVRSMGFTI